MKQVTISARVPEKVKDGEVVQVALGPAAVTFDYPESFEEASGWCSEEAMLSNALRNFAVNPIQSGIRSGLKAGLSQEQLQEKLGKAVMGVAQTATSVDAEAAFMAKFQMATPEEQARMLQKLRERAGLEDSGE